MALGLERRAQRVRVLDDAVMDQGDLAVAIAVGMRIARRRGAVRGPARMCDAARAGDRRAVELGAQCRNPSRELVDHHTRAVLDGDPGGVVAAVLEPMQAVEQEGTRLT